MKLSLLKEYVSAALHELNFDTDAYERAKASLGGIPGKRSTETSKKETKKSKESSSVIEDIAANWESSNPGVNFNEELLKAAEPDLKFYAAKYPDGVSASQMTKITDSLNKKFKSQIQSLGGGKKEGTPGQASWEQVTTNVLDELEKEHNRGRIPERDRDRKFKDTRFREKLTQFLKSQLADVDRQRMQHHDIRRLVDTIKSRFKDDLSRMAPAK